MQVNKVNNNVPNFGAKLNGKMSYEICQDMFSNKKTKLARAYEDKFETLKKVGSPDSEIYLLQDIKGSYNFVLRNPRITSAYQILLGRVLPKQLLESFLKLKPGDVLNGEQELKSLINDKKDFILKAALTDKELKSELLQKTNAETIQDAMNKLDDNTIIDMYYVVKNK